MEKLMPDIEIHRETYNDSERYGITKTVRNGRQIQLFLSEQDFRVLLKTGYELLIAEKESNNDES
jgi:hypothetical protein